MTWCYISVGRAEHRRYMIRFVPYGILTKPRQRFNEIGCFQWN